MARQLNRLLLVCFAMTAGNGVKADPFSGTAMLPGCKAFLSHADSDKAAQGACLGAVSAHLFYTSVVRAEMASCPPENTTVDQAVRVVVEFMEANPQSLGDYFHWLVVEALRKAWPCGDKRRD
jgi:hypothetical protein